MRSLPPPRYYVAQELHREGFRFDADWSKEVEDEEDERREPYPEEGAWYKWVTTDAWGGRQVIVVIVNESENFERPTCYVAVTDIEGKMIGVYRDRLNFTEAAATARELVVRLERNELEIINGKFYPVNESMKKLIEGRHKPGCQCGFCKNMGSFGKKKKDSEKSDDKPEMTAESVVSKLLEDDIPGGSPEGERHDKRGIDPVQLAMGRKVEREHTRGAPNAGKAAEEIAIDHLAEPGHKKYYSRLAKAGLAHELKGGMPKPKGSFYPSMGGPSSV